MARDLETRLEEFSQRLESALEQNLVSLVLYGSAARGQYVPGRSDVNLLIIVRDGSTAALRPAAASIADWARAGEPAPLLFSEEEWRASADVFPVEIEDVRDAHRVLRGRDPVEGLATQREDFRGQLEREVRGKLLRLRTEYAAAAPDGNALARLLENSLRTFLVLFRATLRVKDIRPPADPEALVREAAAAAGIDASAFAWPLARRAGRSAPALKPFDAVAERYVDVIEQLTRVINQL